ncbi:MAG: protein kinase [Myxococcota bacterium]
MDRIGKYTLAEKVGVGGMATVWRGVDTALQREVAIKILHPHLADKPDSKRRFLREARAVARLRHPAIIEIYDYSGEDAETGFIVTEFVRGRNLHDWADEYGVASPEAAALICCQLASALSHAHDCGVIHRDIKPENILVSDDGGLKIADFGIAHVLEAESLTVTGALVGSPAHMAPEQIDGGVTDARTDIFALGTIMYWLSTGMLPFPGETPTAIFRKITEGRCEDPRTYNPAIDNRLAAIILRMITTVPSARPRSMKEVEDELKGWLASSGLGETEAELYALLLGPDDYLRSLPSRVVPTLLAEAAGAMRSGDHPGAMNLCNRALGLNPGNAEAMKLIDRLRSGSNRKRLLAAAAAVIFVSAIIALIFLLYPRSQPVQTSSNQPQPGTPPELQEIALPEPPPLKPAAVPPAIQPPQQTRAVKKPDTQRQFRVLVKPYADVFVDGKLAASDVRDAILVVQPGRHRLEFRNRYFETVESQAFVRQEGPLQELRVELKKLKPAFLKIESAPEASVYVNGAFKGHAGSSMKEPILVPMTMDQNSRKVRIRVLKSGSKEALLERELQPGVVTEVKVLLQPE